MMEVRRESDISSGKTFGSRIKRAFVKSFYKVIEVSQKIVIGAAYMFIPFLIIGSIVGILYIPVSKIRKHKRPKEHKKDK